MRPLEAGTTPGARLATSCACAIAGASGVGWAVRAGFAWGVEPRPTPMFPVFPAATDVVRPG